MVACGLVVLSSWAQVALARVPMLAAELHGYAKASSCQGCHQKQWRQWQDSDHAWAMRKATPDNVLGDFDNAHFNDDAAGVQAHFFRRDGHYYVNTEGANGERRDFRIRYTFGVYPLQQYLVAFPGGRLQSLTVAWDTRPKTKGGQRWFSLYPGEHFAPNDPLRWTGHGHNWNGMCADCHSTDLVKNYDDKTDTFATTWKELSVGCQSCHGPGRAHVEWARKEKKKEKKKIHKSNASGTYPTASDMGLEVDFSSMSSHRIVDQCARCHSRRQTLGTGPQPGKPLLDAMLPVTLQSDLYYPDGQMMGEVYVYGSFAQSKMYHAGVNCMDCHSPHTAKVKIQGNGLCTQCHNPHPPKRFPRLLAKNYDTPAHTHHKPGTAGAQCVSCHMPAHTYMQVDSRRDHFFRIPRPDMTAKTNSPDACTGCHKDKKPQWAAKAIAKWFKNPDRESGYGETLLAARQGRPDALKRLAALLANQQQPSIARATAAEHLSRMGPDALPYLAKALHDPSPMVRAYSTPAFADQPAVQRVKHLLPLLGDPIQAVRDAAVQALAGVPDSALPDSQRDAFHKALQDYERRLRSNADFPGNRLNLAVLLQHEGRHRAALAQYRQALKIDPYFSPARVNLVMLENQAGHNDKAAQLLQNGLALQGLPDADRGHLAYMLGLLQVHQGKEQKALNWLELAAKNLPAQPRIRYNQGLLLLRMGKRERARQVLESGLEKAENNPDLLYAMIYLYASEAKTEQARKYLKRLQRAAPDDPRLPQMRRKLGSGQ